LQLLKDASELLVSGVPIRDALKKILQSITEELNRVDRAAIVLMDLKQGDRGYGVRTARPESEDSTLFHEGCQRVIAVKRPLMISNAKTEEGDIADTLKVLKIQCVLCAPMIFASRMTGVIYLDSVHRPYGFREDDLAL